MIVAVCEGSSLAMPPLSDIYQSVTSFIQAAGSLIAQVFFRVFVRGIFYALVVAPFKWLFFGEEKKTLTDRQKGLESQPK